MLKIQEFIFEHEDWINLLVAAPYNLKITEDDGFVMFKYNQIESDFGQEICQEARGLILDAKDNFKVVRMAFRKFFNLGESYAAHIDWSTAHATEKIDGSLMSVWYARDKWHLSTNGVIDAFKAPLANGEGTFGELFEKACPLATFKDFDKKKCFTFELVSPYNTVVIPYAETKVYLTSIRKMDTLEEYSWPHMVVWADANGFEVPKAYGDVDEQGGRAIVDGMEEGHEGIVVRDGNNNRVKVKTSLYVQLHHMAGNGILTPEHAVQLVMDNEVEEFLAYFPHHREMVNRIKYSMGMFQISCTAIEAEVNGLKEVISNRKDFAMWVKARVRDPYRALYFWAYDGVLGERVETITAKDFAKKFLKH